jgi:AcrR family transcriptional regulator
MAAKKKKSVSTAASARAGSPRDDSRARLIDSALAMLLERGIDAVRVDDVVAEVGVTKGSLYWHFSDRTELIREALLEHVRRLNAEVVEGVTSAISESASTSDYLVRIAPFIIDPYDPAQSQDRRRRLTLMMQAHADPVFAPLIREVQMRSLAVYTDLMREAQAKGFIRPDLDPAAVATALHAINFGSVIIDVLGDGAPSRDAWWSLMMFFIGSLFTPEEPA